MRVTGTFNRPEQIAVDDRGWLFVSETESTIADVMSIDDSGADLDVPNWSMTRHVQEGAILAWLDGHWQARDLAFMLDATRQWRRVEYAATDAVVFANRTLKCAQCGWTGNIDTGLERCPKCSSLLTETEIGASQEAASPLDAGSRFVETRVGFWDHDHCLIAVDTTPDEAYVRNVSHVPNGTPSTSSDVERLGMTLESLVPTAS